MLLDCCHAGAFGHRNVLNRKMLSFLLSENAIISLFSASSDGKTDSLELDGDDHGVFTLALLDALQGQADTDGDRRVTLDEIQKYVTVTVSRRTDGVQVPHLPFPNRYDAKIELIRMIDQH